MERPHAALEEPKDDLEDLGVRWALIGGLAVSAGAEPRTTRDIDVYLPIVKRGQLIALKVPAGRPQDLADLYGLLDFADEEDLALAEQSVRLIVEPGTHRRKHLVADLASTVDGHAGRQL